MPKPKQQPDSFESYIPPAPARAIVVSKSTMAFAIAVYQLELDPYSTWRAESIEQASKRQATWQAQGIASFIVPLPEMLKASDEDEAAYEGAKGRKKAQAARALGC